MTLDEAKVVAHLIGYADGGCSNCVRDLVEQANRMFPAFRWAFVGDDVLDEFPNPHWEGRTITEHRVSVHVELAL